MVKQSGLGWTTLDVDDAAGTPTDIRNDCTNLDIATPRAMQDSTGLDKLAMERIPLLSDGSVNMTGVFNPTGAHTVLSTHNQNDNLRTLELVIAAQTLAMEGYLTDYQLTRAQSGEFTWTTPFVLGDGTVPTWT